MLVVVVSKYVSRSKIGELTMPCRHCSGDFLHTVFRERQTIAVLWLIPIWIRHSYSLLCSSCVELVGASPYPISAERAKELVQQLA
jgi:hypothetical protein